jgi:hypothetical protein
MRRFALAALTAALTACAAQADVAELPNAALTPGAVVSRDVATVCRRGYSRTVRRPDDDNWHAFARHIFATYGVPYAQHREYELDHLVPLEIGGAPADARNLWPQPLEEALAKDRVEDALHAASCYRRGYHGLHVTLEQAQRAVAADWRTTPVGIPAEP